MDADGNETSEIGELLIKGPNIMLGYLNNPEVTAATIQDGWLRTGDLVRIDKEENVWICGRVKDLIKYKGTTMSPDPIEKVLLEHPGIVDAAVKGVFSQEHDSDVPRGYVVAAAQTTLDLAEVLEFANSRLADHQKIRGGIRVIERIPRSDA